tara:strand:- start:1 stop:471 length:471 start_codon:yes stop_codon:yes gene_type:complete
MSFKDIYNGSIYFTGNKSLFDETKIRYQYNNILEYYNQYYLTYKSILEMSEFKDRVLFLDYGKIIDKANIISYLGDKLSYFKIKILKNEHVINVLNKPAKNESTCVKNSDEAFKKYVVIKKNIYRNIVKNKSRIDKKINKDILLFFENKHKLYDFK